MLFNSGSTTNSIVARLNRRAGSNNTNYSLADKATDINEALDRLWYLAMTADGRWQVEDSNQTDLPISTTNLVSGQQDYGIVDGIMEIEKVFAKDQAGNWYELEPVDISQTKSNIHARNIWELPSGNSGIPTHYDKKANSIFLSAIPSYNSSGGLKISYTRGPSYFNSGDTTKAPGIPSIFHPYLVDYAARTYLLDKASTAVIAKKLAELDKAIMRHEDAVTDFYANRTNDEPTVIRTVWRNSR